MTKIAVVTGAAGGMGQAICRQLLLDSFHVIGLDLTWQNDAVLDDAAFRAVTGDLSDAGTVRTIFDGIAAREGHAATPARDAAPRLPPGPAAARRPWYGDSSQIQVPGNHVPSSAMAIMRSIYAVLEANVSQYA